MKPDALRVARLELHEANDFVRLVHRHHDPVTGHRFSFGALTVGSGIVGAAICGRPVGAGGKDKREREKWNHSVLEVLRCAVAPVSATSGYRNACSFLYSRAARIAAELGFRAVITYTSVKEEGASLRACGWWPEILPVRADYSFSSSNRERGEKRGKDMGQKTRWLWLTGTDL